MLRIFCRLVLVEQIEYSFSHVAGLTIVCLLRDGDYGNIIFLKTAFAKAKIDRIPVKSRKAMDYDYVKGGR